MENLNLTFGVFSLGLFAAIWAMFVYYRELRRKSDAKWTESRKESEMKWAEPRKELEASRKEWNDLFKVFIDVKSDVHALKCAVFKKEE